MADESLREFRPEGKQLVFLFISATIVAIVIFLCGVLVGRGLRAPRPVETIATGELGADPTGEHPPAPLTPAASAPPADLPPDTPIEDDLPAIENLGRGTPADNFTPNAGGRAPEDPTRPTPAPVTATANQPAATNAKAAPATKPAPNAKAAAPTAPAPSTKPVEAPAPAKTAAAPEPAADVDAPRTGFQVQVAATPRRSEADSIAARLKRKGYPVFVTTPPKGPRMYRVRVGPYPERKAADAVAAKLDKEEQFKPWVTR